MQLSVTPDTFYSIQNYTLLSGLFEDLIGRFLAPPVSRYLVEIGGRNTYAAVQLSSCLVTLHGFMFALGSIRRLLDFSG